jgi:tetratricopeptide (TPR) repeat protein
VLNQVLKEEPTPPRRVHPKVPRDLETICLKCLQKNPRQRYASAAAVAEDLERFLQGKPIVASPVGPIERLLRWARRNPAAAGLLVALALGVAVSSAFAIALAQTLDAERAIQAELKAALAEVQRSHQFARTETTRAEYNLGVARDSIGKVVRHFLADKRFQDAASVELRKQWLTDLGPVFDVFLNEKPNDPELLQEQAEISRWYGYLEESVGNRTNALPYYRKAADINLALAQRFPDRPLYRAAAGQALGRVAVILATTNGPDAEATLQRANELLARAAEEAPENSQIVLWQLELLPTSGVISKPAKTNKDLREYHHRTLALVDRYLQRARPAPKSSEYIKAVEQKTLAHQYLFTLDLQDGRLDSLESAAQAVVQSWEQLVKDAGPAYESHLTCRLGGAQTALGMAYCSLQLQ